jgi:hypothetical protein
MTAVFVQAATTFRGRSKVATPPDAREPLMRPGVPVLMACDAQTPLATAVSGAPRLIRNS